MALSLAPVPAAGLKEKGTTPLVQGAGTDGAEAVPTAGAFGSGRLCGRPVP